MSIIVDTDIEKVLSEYVLEEMNDNSQGITFDLGYLYNFGSNKGEGYRVISQEPSSYVEFTKDVVPFTIEVYDGDILAIEGLFNAEYTLPLTFQVEIKNRKYVERIKRALEEVKNRNRSRLVRRSIELEGGETEYFTFVTTTSNITPVGDLEIQMGRRYIFLNVNYNFDISKNIVYGNQIKTYLKFPEDEEYMRVYPISPEFYRENTPETMQTFGTNQAFTIIQESQYTQVLALIMQEDDFHWETLEKIFIMKHNNEEDLQFDLDLKLEFYRFIDADMIKKFEFEDTVSVTNSDASFSLGEEVALMLVLTKRLKEEWFYGISNRP